MKKTLSFFLVALMLMFVAACGGSTENNDVADDNTHEEVLTETDNTVSEENEVVADTPADPNLKSDLMYNTWEWYSDGGSEVFYFGEDGTFTNDVYTEGDSYTREGTYTLEGNMLYFNYTDMDDELACEISIENQQLTMTYNVGTPEETSFVYEILVEGC